jgi:hypothetical protein
LVSVPGPTDRGNHSAEGWVIGPEGVAGMPVALGALTAPYRRIVQVGGGAWFMQSGNLIHTMKAIPEFRWVVLGYVHSVLVQAAQSSACNARHPLKGRVARHLIMAHDRLEAAEIALTHDVIAKMLGVRNRITVVDRSKLESLTCSCYTVMKGSFQQSRPDPEPLRAHPAG